MILSLHDTAELFLPVPVPGPGVFPGVFPDVVEGEAVGQTDTADTLLVAVAGLQGRHWARVWLAPGNDGAIIVRQLYMYNQGGRHGQLSGFYSSKK